MNEIESKNFIESLKEIYKPIKKVKKRSISPYLQTNENEKIIKRKINPINKLSLSTQLPSLNNKEITKDEIATKKVLVPYIDNYLLVEESINYLNEWSKQRNDVLLSSKSTSALQLSSSLLLTTSPSLRTTTKFNKNENIQQIYSYPSQSTISLMKRRYPRFCEGLIFDDDPRSYKVRSDLWLIRIIEEIYDSSFSECSKSVSLHRVRNKNNLDLGALDSFPQSARRYISQKYRYFLSFFLYFFH